MTTPIICSIAIFLPITSSEPLPAIPRSSLVIVEDRGPIWRYGMTLHKLHTLPLQQPSPSMILA
ncbi:CRISPR-associated protein Csx3 [Methanothrix sp.]|uniref:CRISPR-associated protein Csx3 n=1 Tax=Methanothrix sp. TaxID=90426 RepID=UPI003BB554D9